MDTEPSQVNNHDECEAGKSDDPETADAPSTTIGKDEVSSDVLKPQEGVDEITVQERREETKERRVLTGMAAMLAMMRGNGGDEPAAVEEETVKSEEIVAENPKEEAGPQIDNESGMEQNELKGMNRKERRAMMRTEPTQESEAGKSNDPETSDAASTTIGKDEASYDVLKPQDEVDEITVNERREERKERRVLTGMAAMLAMMRGNGGDETATEEEEKVKSERTIAETPKEETGPQVDNESGMEQNELKGLNRKERRAMMRNAGAFEDSVKRTREEEQEKKMETEEKITVHKKRVALENPSLVNTPSFTLATDFAAQNEIKGFQPVLNGNNYLKDCHFSSSGRFISTTSQDRILRIFGFDEGSCEASPVSRIPLGGVVYNSAWHPLEDLVASTSRDHPIHLWKPDGERIASFRGINHLDELSAANSIAFSLQGDRLYAGYTKYLRVFDVNRPGRQTREIKTWNRGDGGQKSVLSCIAVHPFIEGVIAVGCYGRNIGLYSDRSKFADCLFSIDFAALTQLQYSPDGLRLYGSTRNDGVIGCWDLRNPGPMLCKFDRPGYTNQRFAFELDGSGSFLFSGSSTGEILVFHALRGTSDPIQSVAASAASTVGVSLHPSLPVLATASGQRIFRVLDLSDEEGDGEPSLDSASPPEKRSRTGEEKAQLPYYSEGQMELDNALKLWRL